MNSDTATAIPANGTPSADIASLTPDELLAHLAQQGDRAPMELIEAAAAHAEAMVQAIATMINDNSIWDCDEDEAWWLPLHCAYILARIPSESAGLLLLHLMRQAERFDDEILQDWLGGDWPTLFENKPARVIDAVRELISDTTLGWFVRCQGVEAVLDAGLRQSPEALDHAIDWVAEQASDESDDWLFRILSACDLLDFPRQRHRAMLEAMAVEDTRRAKAEGFGAGTFDLSSVKVAYAQGMDDPGWLRRASAWDFYKPEIIAGRQERWRAEAEQQAERAEQAERRWIDNLPYVRATEKISRNDPCPCGSGKKYKRCCLAS